MEDQSPYVSSSHPGGETPEPEEQLYRAADKQWDDDLDVLDLTGGQYSHPPFSVSFPPKPAAEDDDKPSYSDSLEASPEDEEPSSIGSDAPPAPVIPSAPVEEHDIAPAPYGAPSSGSVDVNLFPLPAASAPLMLSSADNIMDLQQPSSIATAGKEDLSSLLLESTTSLPSLSPLSADYPKENTIAAAFPADSTPTPDSLQGSDSETDILEKKNLQYAFSQGQFTEDSTISEKGYTVEHPTSEPESVPVEHTKVYTQSAKEMFSGMLKSVGPPHEEFTDLKEEVDEHYVDFKPFASSKGLDFGFEPKDMVVDFKSNVGHLIFESIKPEEKYNEGKDIDLSDDISPASPEAISDSSQYEIFASSQQAAPLAYGSNPFAEHKPEEKKMEDIEAVPRLGSNVATVNPFLEHVDYVTTDRVSANIAPQPSNKTEGLTPDIVQEAYESEVCDIGIPKLNYEPKIDLVQTTAKVPKENVTPPTQNTGLFEDSESVSSPVLPDIVMEAPLTSAPIGLSTISPQPDVSPVEHVIFATEEKMKFESETPLFKDVDKATLFEEEPAKARVEPVKEKQAEEAEAPYISIACDLIKETIPEKVTDFSMALKTEFDSQYAVPYDESSPESEPSEPSYKHWESEVISKAASVTIGSVKPYEVALEKEQESEPVKEQVASKAYLESESYLSDNTFVIPKEMVPQLSSQEKALPTEAFGKASLYEELPHFTETVKVEKAPAASFFEEFVSKPRDDQAEAEKAKPRDDHVVKDEPKKPEVVHTQAKESAQASDKLVDFSKTGPVIEEGISKPVSPAKGDNDVTSTTTEKKQPSAPPAPGSCHFNTSVVDLLYWRDIKKSGAVFGASLFLLLSLTVFSIVSVSAYIALALLSITISFRIYKGILQAIQKSDEGHPFKSFLDSNVVVSEDVVQKYCNVVLGHINSTIKELRRLFLVEDLVDSLKFAVLMWVFTYIGALFNGLTLLILALISLFSIPVLYERHQAQVDHYLALISKNVNSVKELVVSKIPGLKRKAE